MAATAFACSGSQEADDDDDDMVTTAATSANGNGVTGTTGVTGGATTGVTSGTGGAGSSAVASATTATSATQGTSVASATSAANATTASATSGSTTGGSTFNGGSRPLTDDELTTLTMGACAGWSSEGESIPSVLELVIDVSSSMSQEAPGGNGASKWDVTRDALLEAIVGVNGPGLPGSVAVGLLFYPNVDEVEASPGAKDITYCVNTAAMVPPATLGGPDAPHRDAIRAGIAGVQLQTSTPTHDAFGYALEQGLLPANLPGEKFMLLITDGEPTLSQGCQNPESTFSGVDPQPIVEVIDVAWQLGIQTFLIGSPGSEPNRPWMSEAAVLAGTAWTGCEINGPDYCHMDMTEATNFSEALRQGLGAVIGQLSTCTYSFPDPPAGRTINGNEINVVVTADDNRTLIVRDDIGDCSEGWQLTADNQILLCPTTCADVQIDPNITLDIMFGCESLAGPLQ